MSNEIVKMKKVIVLKKTTPFSATEIAGLQVAVLKAIDDAFAAAGDEKVSEFLWSNQLKINRN